MNRFKDVLIVGLLIVISVAAFFPILSNDFINWEDNFFVYENTLVRSLATNDVVKIFTEPVRQLYIPLTILSYALDYHFSQYDPFSYHLINLLLHIVVVILIYIFALLCGTKALGAGLAALLFAVHPIHLEAVAWVAERKTLLYSMFYLMSLIHYVTYIEKRARICYILSLVFGFLSMLAHPMALSLPFVLFAVDIVKKRKGNFVNKVFYILYTIPLLWRAISLKESFIHESIGQSILLWIGEIVFSLQRFIAPVQFNPVYQFPQPVSIQESFYLLMTIGLVVFGAVMILFRKERWVVFGGLFFIFSIVFVHWLFGPEEYKRVGDRYMYLPSLGFCLMFGYYAQSLLYKLKKIKFVFVLVLVGLFVGLGWTTHQRTYAWQDSETFWTQAINANPKNIMAYNQRSMVFNEQGEFDRAIADSEQVLTIDSKNYEALSNQGLAYMMTGQFNLAKKNLDRAIEINPSDAMAYNSRGFIYMNQGKLDQALVDFNWAISLEPNKEEIFFNRAMVYIQTGKFPEALQDFNRAVELNPFDEEAYTNRGLLYFQQYQHDLAIADFNKALEINPNQAEIYLNRGSVYFKKEKYSAALQDFNMAVKLRPEYTGALLNRSMVYVLLGEKEKALNDALKAEDLGHNVDPRYLEQIRLMEQNELPN